MEYGIEWVVRRLRDNRSGGPYGMRSENLPQWLWEARKSDEAISEVTGSGLITEVDMETLKEAETAMYIETETAVTVPLALSHWQRVVVLLQADLQEGRVEEESTWQTVVLITNDRRY